MNGEDRDRDRAQLASQSGKSHVETFNKIDQSQNNSGLVFGVSNPEAITLNCYLIQSLIIKSRNLTHMNYASISANEHIRISSLLKQISTDVRIIVTGAGDSVG